MESRTANSCAQGLDVEAAKEQWLARLPAPVRRSLLGPADLDRILEWCFHFLSTGSVEVLAELDVEVTRLAHRLQDSMGQDAALRLLRDGLARSLAPCVRTSPECAESVLRILGRVTDAIWRAYTDQLQATLRRERDEHLVKELTVAKRIQERLLPRTVPHVPNFDIAGRVYPAAEVGGDYWSCRSYPEDDIVTCKLADVTGHGIGAATLVAAVKFISGGYYRGSKTAAQVMERTNTVLSRETPSDILVTMVYGWLYPRSHEMTVVNAGHSPVLHCHEGEFVSIAPTGPALGMMDTRYREVRLSMEPGDLFFSCSDGVTQPSSEASLGEDWVRDQVIRGSHLPAAALVDQVLEGALAYYGTPRDDMSVIVVKCTG